MSIFFFKCQSKEGSFGPKLKSLTFCMKLYTLRALMANIAISFSICSPKYLNKTFLVLNFKVFTQHETFIFKQFEGTDFKFNTHSYSNSNIQTRCVVSNGKLTLFCWRYFIFINLKLLISNLSITFWNSYSETPTLSTFYPQVCILLNNGMMISGVTKNYNFNRPLF